MFNSFHKSSLIYEKIRVQITYNLFPLQISIAPTVLTKIEMYNVDFIPK